MSGTAQSAAAARPRRRIWRWALLAIPALLIVLMGGVAWWAGSDGSLLRALRLAQGWLPEGQSLEFSDVEGSLGGGGRIGRIVWSKPGLTVTINDLRLAWTLREALGRDLHVRTLAASNVHMLQTPQPEPPPAEPFVMPERITLPVKATVPLAIGRLQLERVDESGAVNLQEIHDLRAGYRYNGTWHALRLASLRYGESTLQASARLHARELSLSTELDAALRNLVEGNPLAMQLQLRADGSLAGGDAARMDVQLDATDTSAQINAQAILHPWRAQPVQQLELTATALNAQAFHAAAPMTSLQGRLSVLPVAGEDAAAWNAVLDFTNATPGTWDARHLPLRQISATLGLTLERADIEAAQLMLSGAREPGLITLSGEVPLTTPLQSSLQLQIQHLDLQSLASSQPRTDLGGSASLAPGEQGSWRLQVDLRNTLPGPLDRERLPLDRLLAAVNGTPERITAETLELQVGTGKLQVQGSFAPPTRALDVRGAAQDLPLRRIHQKMANDANALLTGTFGIDGDTQQGLAFEADLASTLAAGGDPASQGQWEIRALQAAGTWSPDRLAIERIHLDAFQAQADGTAIDIALPDFSSIGAHLTGTAPGLVLTADAQMRQQSGGGTLQVQLDSAGQLLAWMKDLPLIGERVPQWRAEGGANIDARWQGGWRQWQAAMRNPASQQRLSVNATAHTTGLLIELPAGAGESGTRVEVRKFDLDVQGNLAAATLDLDADVRANETVALLDVRLQSTQQRGRGGAPQWMIAVERFAAMANLQSGQQPWSLSFSDALQVSIQGGPDTELHLTAGSATLSAPPEVAAGDVPLQIAWEPMLWRRTARGALNVQSTGTITGLQPGWLDVVLARDGEGPLGANGMRTDLVLSGSWDVQMTDHVNVRAHIERESGDVWLDEGRAAAGIQALEVTVQSAGQDVRLAVRGDTQRGGLLAAELATRLERRDDGWHLPDGAPLDGSIEARVRDMSSWTFFAPPGWRIGGALAASIQLGGTVQAPRLDGSIEGSALMLRSVLDGVELHDGTLRAGLAGTRLTIAELTFEGGTGSRAHVRGFSGNLTPPPTARGRMTVSGHIDWSAVAEATAAASGIVMDLEAELERMQVLVRNDRQMSLSGQMSADLEDGALSVRGDLRVDRAAVVLPEASAPTVGDDVVILREADLRNPSDAEARQRSQLETRRPIDLEVQLNLGRDLALEGQGITTRLEGELTVRSNAGSGDPFRIFGEVRTVEGRYRAWGQALDVESGVVRFNGPMMNPSLDLLAIRPEIEVRAGVRVTGTLLAPRVQLYSQPDLPEGEKLSWVVLGRPTLVAGGEGTNMQQAALSLAAGQLAGGLGRGLGLDELGLDEGAVTIGKRITNELYLTYQAGLSGAASTLYIFYDITRRLTVRGQTGEASAVDLIFTVKYD